MFGFFPDMASEKQKPKLTKTERGAGHIPIKALNKMGCEVCPRNESKESRNPKLEPDGNSAPMVYFLGSHPSPQDDDEGYNWLGDGEREVTGKLKKSWMQENARFGHITQCEPHSKEARYRPGPHELECCRPRVVRDIEESRPLIVVGLGDAPLQWATGMNQTIALRGQLIATKIGRHPCWYYPILYPNYIERKSKKTSEYEMTLDWDLKRIQKLAQNLESPKLYDAPYDTGIEMITGQEEGDMQRLEEALHWLITCGAHGFDIETNDLRPYQLQAPSIITAAAGTFERVIAWSVDHYDGWGTETRTRKVRQMTGEYIRQSGRKRCHNAAFEMEWTACLYGEDMLRKTEWEDTQAMAHSLDERKGFKSLDDQTRMRFGFFLKDQSRVDVKRPEWWKLYPLREILRYNGLDSKWTDRLADVLIYDVRSERRTEKLYERFMRSAPTLVLTTARGMPIDIPYAARMLDDIQGKLQVIEAKGAKLPEIKKYVAKYGTFEWTNADHVLTLMRDVCKRPEVRREDKSGKIKWTSDEEALEMIPRHELASPPLILDHRQLTRCDTTYLRPIVDGKLVGTDGMNHSEYSQLFTATGRLSSPMHNWPKHKHIEVRGAVAASDGYWLVAADQGQIEFRVAGMLSQDPNIIKYCWTGYDVHAYWAQRIIDEWGGIKDLICEEFEVDWDEKGFKTLRQTMKNTWVFPQLFGATTESCAARIGIPEDIAATLGREFWDEFRGAKKWQLKLIDSYEKHNYVETAGGFRRRGPTTVNELINMPIQGTALEIVMGGMDALSERSQLDDNPDIQPAFNGHDDLTFLVPDSHLEDSIDIITHEMCMPRFDYINCPLIVEVSVGARWHELKEVGKYSSEKLFNLHNPYK